MRKAFAGIITDIKGLVIELVVQYRHLKQDFAAILHQDDRIRMTWLSGLFPVYLSHIPGNLRQLADDLQKLSPILLPFRTATQKQIIRTGI